MKNILTYEEREEIDKICQAYNIKGYKINNDGSIDVEGDVLLSYKKITSIPVKFNIVKGSFYCNENRLTSLEGFPKEVGGSISCSFNQLFSLDGYIQDMVRGNFYCNDNNLTTLEGCPSKVLGNFHCSGNRLTSLEYCPTIIGGEFISIDPESENDFGSVFRLEFEQLNNDQRKIFAKYQSHFDIWTPDLDVNAFMDLIHEIKEGLE